MLLLSRKASEQIVIGPDVVVTVARIRGNRVDLAISAPQDVPILRAELDPLASAVPSPAESRSGH